MTTKGFIGSTVLAFLLSNILTTLWYMATSDMNSVAYQRPEPNYLALMVNHLIYAGLMVYLFPFFYSLNPNRSRAFLYGVLVAALMYLPQAIVIRAIWEVAFDLGFVLNSLAHLLIGGLMGLAISFTSGSLEIKAS